jgi:hypothetical protein
MRLAVLVVYYQLGWVEQIPWAACPQGAGKEARPGHPDYKVWFLRTLTSLHISSLEDMAIHMHMVSLSCLYVCVSVCIFLEG